MTIPLAFRKNDSPDSRRQPVHSPHWLYFACISISSCLRRPVACRRFLCRFLSRFLSLARFVTYDSYERTIESVLPNDKRALIGVQESWTNGRKQHALRLLVWAWC